MKNKSLILTTLIFILFASAFVSSVFAAEGTFLTDEKIIMRLYPEADEGTNNWTATTSCVSAHWDCVDETSSDSDSTYIETNSSSTEDRFNVQDIPWSSYPISSSTAANQILRIELYVQAKDPTCSPSCGSISAKINSTSTILYFPEATTTKSLTNSYAEYWFAWMLKPSICSPTCNDTQPWTLSDINNIVVSPYCASGTCRVTQMEVRVVWERMVISSWLTANNSAGVLRKATSGMIYSAVGANMLINRAPDWETNNYTGATLTNGTGIIGGFSKASTSDVSRNLYLDQTTGGLRTSFIVTINDANPTANNSAVLAFKEAASNDYLQVVVAYGSSTGDEFIRIKRNDPTLGLNTLNSSTFNLESRKLYLVTAFYDYPGKSIDMAICAYDMVTHNCSSATTTMTLSDSWADAAYDVQTGYFAWRNSTLDSSDPVFMGMAQACSDKKITITGLPNNYSAKLYQDNGTLVASSTETSGNRTLTLPGWVPCVSYHSTINIYDDTATLIYQTHVSQDMAGGDVWTWTANESIVAGPMVVVMEETTAAIWAKAIRRTGSANYRVKYRLKDSGTSWSYSSAVTLNSSNRWAEGAELTGLSPATNYEYQAQTDWGGGYQDEGSIQYFKTACQSGKSCSFSFTFGACKKTSAVPFPIFCKIKDSLNPDFNMEIGDFVYFDDEIDMTAIENNENSRASMESKFLDVWMSYCVKYLTANMPNLFQRDDHDEANNPSHHELYPYHFQVENSFVDPTNTKRRYDGPYRADVTKSMNGVYWFSAIPDNLKRSTVASDGYEYAFSYGDIRFILPDTRWYRENQYATDNASKKLWGDSQKTWLINQISSPPAGTKLTFLVVPSATKFSSDFHNASTSGRSYKSEDVATCATGGLGECDGGYETDVAAVWEEVCKSEVPVAVLSGDAHIASLVYRTNWNVPGSGLQNCSDVAGAKRSGWYDIRSSNLGQPLASSVGEGDGTYQYDGRMYYVLDNSYDARHVAKVSVNTNYKDPKIFVEFYKYTNPANGSYGTLTLNYSRELQINEISGLRATSTVAESSLQQKIIRRTDGYYVATYASSSTQLLLEVSEDTDGFDWGGTPITGDATKFQLCVQGPDGHGASLWNKFNRVYYICNTTASELRVGAFNGTIDEITPTIIHSDTANVENRYAGIVMGTDGYAYAYFEKKNVSGNYVLKTARSSSVCSDASLTGCITGSWDALVDHGTVDAVRDSGSIVSLANGKMLIVWRADDDIKYQYCTTCTSTSSDWSTETNLVTNGATTTQNIGLVSDESNYAWLAYSNGTAIIASRFDSSTNTWSATTTIAASGSNPSITVVDGYVYISDIESTNILKVYRCRRDLTNCALYRSLTGAETLYSPQLSRQSSRRGAALLFAEKGVEATSNQYRLSVWPIFSEWGNRIYNVLTPAKIMGQSIFNIQNINGRE
ncbi:MAG: alkaline phosphatase D family protein [Patescibacteria group bacterium]